MPPPNASARAPYGTQLASDEHGRAHDGDDGCVASRVVGACAPRVRVAPRPHGVCVRAHVLLTGPPLCGCRAGTRTRSLPSAPARYRSLPSAPALLQADAALEEPNDWWIGKANTRLNQVTKALKVMERQNGVGYMTPEEVASATETIRMICSCMVYTPNVRSVALKAYKDDLLASTFCWAILLARHTVASHREGGWCVDSDVAAERWSMDAIHALLASEAGTIFATAEGGDGSATCGGGQAARLVDERKTRRVRNDPLCKDQRKLLAQAETLSRMMAQTRAGPLHAAILQLAPPAVRRTAAMAERQAKNARAAESWERRVRAPCTAWAATRPTQRKAVTKTGGDESEAETVVHHADEDTVDDDTADEGHADEGHADEGHADDVAAEVDAGVGLREGDPWEEYELELFNTLREGSEDEVGPEGYASALPPLALWPTLGAAGHGGAQRQIGRRPKAPAREKIVCRPTKVKRSEAAAALKQREAEQKAEAQRKRVAAQEKKEAEAAADRQRRDREREAKKRAAESAAEAARAKREQQLAQQQAQREQRAEEEARKRVCVDRTSCVVDPGTLKLKIHSQVATQIRPLKIKREVWEAETLPAADRVWLKVRGYHEKRVRLRIAGITPPRWKPNEEYTEVDLFGSDAESE